MSHDALGLGIACGQLVFGLACLIWGLRGNAYQGNSLSGRLLTRYFAPVGLWFMLAAAFQLLMGRVPDTPLITLAGLSFVAIGVWGIRIHRTFKAHARELIRNER
jgi:Ca2+/H+ antiporter